MKKSGQFHFKFVPTKTFIITRGKTPKTKMVVRGKLFFFKPSKTSITRHTRGSSDEGLWNLPDYGGLTLKHV